MTTGTDGTPGQAPGTPASAPVTTPPTALAAPEGFVEVARLNGALAKIQELTLTVRSLTEQLAAKDQSLGSFQAQLAQKETEWSAKAGEFTKSLEAINAEKKTLADENSKFQADQLKMKIIRDLKRPELYDIMNVIPNDLDEAALRPKIESLASFAAQLAQQREAQLMAGVTHVENVEQVQPTLPTTEQGWTDYINGLPLGSPDRQKAFDAWHKSLMNQK